MQPKTLEYFRRELKTYWARSSSHLHSHSKPHPVIENLVKAKVRRAEERHAIINSSNEDEDVTQLLPELEEGEIKCS